MRDAPTRGMIAYEDPAPRGTVRGQGQPTRLVFLSAGEDADSPELMPESGQLGWKEDGSRQHPKEGATREWKLRRQNFAGTRPALVSGEDFADLWTALGQAGIFDLPPFPGRKPPPDRPYILMDSVDDVVIFTRPQPVAVEQMKIWARAIEALVAFSAFTQPF